MPRSHLHFRTVVLSDIHLGAPEAKVDEVDHFLRHIDCERLILNGDIIDGWSLRRRGGWDQRCTRFVRRILKRAEKGRTEVVYVRGNHDDILAGFLPIYFDRLRIVDEYVHRAADGTRYLVVHGDAFDAVTTTAPWLAHVGDIGYQWLLTINRGYNRWRAWRGKPWFSLSRMVKARVKQAVSHISRFEEHLVHLAERRGCEGVLCGHIHTPEDRFVGAVRYLNSGDWVESLTALVEDQEGRFSILEYHDFEAQLAEARRGDWRRLAAVAAPSVAGVA